ncbi:U3 small nucleolar RNA-associated protein 14 [Oryza sativa Japonica Group]|uniref:Os03g0343300 protein n=3 Tax=Oryza sativa TaxID=4530 RepID=Q10LM2_ORYSJ|nr:U3 small nucleolar RNA-associated protein 14 [Oryza sativa Japonica Group]EAY90047.1 hypothetical protein OsI_11618 [Oryza sativa Indica Group]KAB8091744.1 hypothetical protein EE612_017336 [Oryza sativa]ABF95877.1 Utp14 protein, expressed [Oryza sativa Japonica Group]EAZ26876.1 hypothetical protein OsJ_10800 [Oryza sativa Japonica Group]KAF2939181.1 hypothetical protein DAI22_03g173400 [Oryza sativa Japonica Group]
MAGTKPRGKPKSRALVAGAAHGGKEKKGVTGGAGKRGDRRGGRHGPRLPTALRRQLDALGPGTSRGSDEDEEAGSDDEGAHDVYEYEEGVPEEEAGKNGRYDAVEKYEYEFDSDASNADEDVPSDEGEDMEEDDAGEDEDEEKQIRILQETTGMPREAFDGGKRKKQPLELPFQPGVGDGPVTIHDLLNNIQGKPGYSKLRKRLQQQEKKPIVVQAPLAKVEREKLERGVVYQQSKKEVTKWEPLVKRNREAPTLYFENDLNLGVNTVGAIASEFKPRNEFEKQMAEIMRSTEMMEAHKNDGVKILELNKIDMEDVRERQNRLAKMRSLLFRHEMKAKRIKKIKSRTYHRMLKKDKLKAASADFEADPEAAKEHAMKQEFKRAEERMRLKHKNTSKWAKRILKRGLDVQDEGTRAAIAAQLQQNALLTRKMNSTKDDSSSSEESSDDEEDDDESEANILNKGKEKILKILGDDNEIPTSGVFSLPFMERAMKKHEEATYEEARLALEECDESLRKLEDGNTEENGDSVKVTGKRTFGPAEDTNKVTNKKQKLDDGDKNSDSEYESDSAQHLDDNEVHKIDDVQIGTALLDDDEPQDDLFKSFDDIIKNPGRKTTVEVGMLADNSWKKFKSSKGNDGSNTNGDIDKSTVKVSYMADQKLKQLDHNSDSDSEDEMVEGLLTISDAKENYKIPSQADLIRQAFAGDDVEAEFEKDKLDVLNEENPEPEKPALVPGWGQWTDIQQKKGLPSWMVKEHENAKRKREEALKRRKDAKLKHVIISEHVDKKAEKLLVRNLPFPYTSKDVYEQSIRMPIGPDFNPAISVAALNRPAIVKKPGVVIKPIQYEEVDPHEKPDEPKRVIQRAVPNPKAKRTSAKQAKAIASNKRK